MNDNWKIVIQGGSKRFLVGLVISIIATLTFWLTLEYYIPIAYDISDLVGIFSACLIAISLIYTGKAIELNRQIHIDRITFDMAINFENITAMWYKEISEDATIVRMLFQRNEDFFTDRSGAERLVEYLKDHLKVNKAFTSVLNFLEHVAIMVDRELISEEQLEKTFKGVYKMYYTKTIHYVDIRRELNNDLRKENYKHFQEIARKWV